MATLFIRHTVANFATWKQVYDSVADFQKSGGVTAQAVYQAADNPNDVTITHDFASLEQAQAFSNNPELRAIMERAGVVGAPTLWFTNRA